MRKSEKNGRKILPGVWQLNRNTFIVRVQPKNPQTGRKLNIRRVLEGGTRAQAIELREQLLAEARAPVGAHTNQDRVGDFATWWLEHKTARGDIEGSTAERYAVALDHLSEAILESRLDEVSPAVIEEWMVTATRPGEDRRRYAHSTVNSWLRVLRTLFNDACRLRGLSRNPAAAARALVEPTNLEETNSLPPEQLSALLCELRSGAPEVAMAAWTLAWTGLRWGEVTALRWSDLDEARRILSIRHKVQKGRSSRARRRTAPGGSVCRSRCSKSCCATERSWRRQTTRGSRAG